MRLRTEIKVAKGRLDAVKRAPLPLDAQRGLIVQAVAEKARTGRPTVRIANDAASISERAAKRQPTTPKRKPSVTVAVLSEREWPSRVQAPGGSG